MLIDESKTEREREKKIEVREEKKMGCFIFYLPAFFWVFQNITKIHPKRREKIMEKEESLKTKAGKGSFQSQGVSCFYVAFFF